MQNIHTLLKNAELRWTSHVIRMSDERLPKKEIYGKIQEAKRCQCSRDERYKDNFKASLKDFKIPTESWEQTIQDRAK